MDRNDPYERSVLRLEGRGGRGVRVNAIRQVRANLAILAGFGAIGFSLALSFQLAGRAQPLFGGSPLFIAADLISTIACLCLLALSLIRLTSDRVLFNFALVVEVLACATVSYLAPSILGTSNAEGQVSLPYLTWTVPILLAFSYLVPATLGWIRLSAFLSGATIPLGVLAFLLQNPGVSLVSGSLETATLGAAFSFALVYWTTPLLHDKNAKVTLYGHYHLDDRIGSGGFGTVWAASHVYLSGLRAAIKLVPFDRLAPTRAQASMNTFWAEAEKTAQLRATQTVRVRDFGSTFQHLYLTMELLDGHDLNHLPRPVAPRRVSEILGDICLSLEEAHALGLLHLDLKPGNVMVLPTGEVKVLDFGIGALLALQPRAALPAGTLGYRSPEQIRNETAGPTSDIYSLGCLAFFLLTGEEVFETADPDRDHLESEPRLPSTRVPAAAPLDPIVDRCLRKAPVDRFQTARDLRAALDSRGGAVAGRPPAKTNGVGSSEREER